jgi:hypothetical protein
MTVIQYIIILYCRVVDPDPDWIVFSDFVDPDPYWESGSRGKKIKKFQWKKFKKVILKNKFTTRKV